MRKCIAGTLCCLIVAALTTGTPAGIRGLQTQDPRLQTPDWLAVVSSESAVLYSGPVPNAPVIQKMAKGDVVRVDLEFTGETGRWYKVSTVGQASTSGYTRAENLSVQSPPDTTAWEYKPPPEPSGENTAEGGKTKPERRILVPITRAQIEKDVRAFFATRFGRSAPVSADGQTILHSRMGFDHSNAVDIAVSPDSAEGQALMNHLRAMGIPFIAFRRAVPGSATGAHIHVGIPSPRVARLR